MLTYKKTVDDVIILMLGIVIFVHLKWFNKDKNISNLPLQKGVQWVTSYDSFMTSSFNVSKAPKSHEEIAAVLARVEEDGATVTIRGSGFSFGGHSLPPVDTDRIHYILSTSLLKEIKCIHTLKHEVILEVGAGVTWEEAIRHANSACGLASHQRAIPYSAPTARSITISGSIAAHTHSRTTIGTGGYAHEHVSKFTLITPRNEYECYLLKSLRFTPDICTAAVGSFGRLGVINQLYLHLKIIDEKVCVESKVLFTSCDMKALTTEYVKVAVNDTKYDFGISAVFHSRRGQGYVFGSHFTTCEETTVFRNVFPGFDGPTLYNKIIYALGHWIGSNIHSKFLTSTFYEGRIGFSDAEKNTFFQDTHDSSRTLMTYFTTSPPLPIVHQSWFISGDNISRVLQFIQLMHKAMNEESYSQLQELFELGDTLRIPASHIPTHPSYHYGVGHIYTVTFAVHTELDYNIAKQFCWDISSRSSGSAIPLLLKGIEAPSVILRDAHSEMLEFVEKFANGEDPAGILDSMFWRKISP